jgi:hypothetical protein
VFISGYVHQAAPGCLNDRKSALFYCFFIFADFISAMDNEVDSNQSKK